jgi:salicylate hydroxylase
LPYLASGAVMALEDAVVLGQQLAESGDDPAAAFRAYENIRQPRDARIVENSHRLAGVYHAGPPLSFFRDRFILFNSGRRGLERMAWLYDWRP